MFDKAKIILLGLTCLLFVVVSGCVETSMMHQGNSVTTAMTVVELQKGGPHADVWETFDIMIDYKYTQGDGEIEVSGQAVLSEHYQMNYNSLSKLFVYIYILDKDSRVLKTGELVRSMTGSVEELLTFSQQYEVPSGAASVTFGYDGVASEFQGATSFYELPLSRN